MQIVFWLCLSVGSFDIFICDECNFFKTQVLNGHLAMDLKKNLIAHLIDQFYDLLSVSLRWLVVFLSTHDSLFNSK